MRNIGNLYREAGGPGWALVGDALHQKDPLDGQGIYDAVLTAKLLAQALIDCQRGALSPSAALARYAAEVRAAQAQVIAEVLPRVRDIRRFGSAALDLVWTAAGRCDAYWERGTKRWDVAAGALVCERAGLVVAPLPARGVLPDGQLAAPPALLDELLALVG